MANTFNTESNDTTPAFPHPGLVYQVSMTSVPHKNKRDVLLNVSYEIGDFLEGVSSSGKVLERLNYLGPTDPPAIYQCIVTITRLGPAE